jgi:hypothetical protein
MVEDLGDAWTGQRARLSREGATPELVLMDAAGEVQSRFTLDASLVADLVVTDALFGAIDRANGVLDTRQQAFEAQTKGFREWGFDNDTGILSFVLANGQPLRGPGIVVGSWGKDSATWMWSWGNDSAGPKAHAATAPIRDAALDAPGLAALRKRTFPCSLALASHLAVIAASRIGADGVFGGRHPGGVVFIAAMP